MADVISAKTAWALSKLIKGKDKKQLGARTATVTRVDPDGTAWVRMAGSDIDTPVNGIMTASVKAGDVIQCSIDGTALSITGNASDPAVGASKASQIVNAVVRPVSVAVGTAHGIAKAAEKVASAINQHFWADTSGVHVTQATQEEWESQQSGPNVLINSLGQLFRDGLNNLLTITTESGARALTIWDGAGNAAANVLASFSADLVELGRNSASAVISFCNGTGYLRYDTINGFTLSTNASTGGSTPGAGVGVSADTANAMASMGASVTGSANNASRIECRSGPNGKYIKMDAPALMLADNGLTSTGTRVTMRKVIELFTEDIGWTNLQLSSGVVVYSSAAHTPKYCRRHGIVEVVGEVSPRAAVEAGGTLTIGTLPSGCRPTQRTTVLCQGSTLREWMLQVNADGTMVASRYRLGTATEDMSTNTWLPLHMTFVAAAES